MTYALPFVGPSRPCRWPIVLKRLVSVNITSFEIDVLGGMERPIHCFMVQYPDLGRTRWAFSASWPMGQSKDRKLCKTARLNFSIWLLLFRCHELWGCLGMNVSCISMTRYLSNPARFYFVSHASVHVFVVKIRHSD